MSCVKQEDILAYLKGELGSGEAPQVKAHLESCVSCLRYMNQVDVFLGAVRRWKGIEPSPDFVDRVENAMIQAHPEWVPNSGQAPLSFSDRLRSWKDRLVGEFRLVPAWAISAAVHVVLFAIFALIFVSYTPVSRDSNVLRVTQRPPEVPSITAPVDPIKPRTGPMGEEGPIHADVDDPTIKRDFTPTESDPQFKQWVEQIVSPQKLDRDLLNQRIKEDAILSFVSIRDDAGGRAQRLEGAGPALDRALAWLAANQRSDGSWAVEKFYGKKDYEVGLTALAALAFLGNGNTHKKGDYKGQVSRAVDYLIKRQDASGLIGGKAGNYMYNHGIATLALLENYIMTRDERFEVPVLSALAYIMYAQNSSGGWGYEARSRTTDTSVTVWLVLPLRLARSIGRKETIVPALMKVRPWLTDLIDTDGRVGYQKRGQYPNGYHTLTSIGMFVTEWTVLLEDDDVLQKQSAHLLGRAPLSGEKGREMDNDLYYAYFGSLAMYQLGDEPWQKWYAPVRSQLLQAQQKDGSWAADFDRWSSYGGQIYTTAMGALILETPIRYPRLKTR